LSHLEEEILRFEREREPGEVFHYKSGDNALLALVLDRALDPETITVTPRVGYGRRRGWNTKGRGRLTGKALDLRRRGAV